jgi:xanthine/uracil permease
VTWLSVDEQIKREMQKGLVPAMHLALGSLASALMVASTGQGSFRRVCMILAVCLMYALSALQWWCVQRVPEGKRSVKMVVKMGHIHDDIGKKGYQAFS